MSISRGCICSAEGVYIYRGEGVHLSRRGVRLMSPYFYITLSHIHFIINFQYLRLTIDNFNCSFIKKWRFDIHSLLTYKTLSNKQIDMFKSFKFVSSQKTRAVEVSKSVFDFVELFFLHDDEIMRNKLTYNTEIVSKFRQKRRRRNKNDEKVSIRRRQIKKTCRWNRKADSIAEK